MYPISCPYFDHLGLDLIDSYRRMEDRDLFCLLYGREVPNEIEAIHLAMAEHRRDCPLCRRIDHATTPRRGDHIQYVAGRSATDSLNRFTDLRGG